ncbi:unnamed protein product [Lampetra fluviatilis]
MDENEEKCGQKRGCAECCVRCLGGVPYASLLATVLCYAGVALFCGGGHEALSGTLALLQAHFGFPHDPELLFFTVVEVVRFVIYGVAAAFFLYGVLLFTEGFFTTASIRDSCGDFKTSACGRCVSAWFLGMTYLLAVVWLALLVLSALPVFVAFSVQASCDVIAPPLFLPAPSSSSSSSSSTTSSNATRVCIDMRQYGIIPWNVSTGQLCDADLANLCNSQTFKLTYSLYIVACAGAAATVIAMVHYLLALSANWAAVGALRRLGHEAALGSREQQQQQEPRDVESARSKERLNAYA